MANFLLQLPFIPEVTRLNQSRYTSANILFTNSLFSNFNSIDKRISRQTELTQVSFCNFTFEGEPSF